MRERIRVLVVAADPRLTRVLARALPARGAVVVSGPIADADDAANTLAAGLADLAVVDLDRADGSGIHVLATVAAGGRARVLAATEVDGPEVAANALSAGACGLLPRARDRSLLDVFRRALAGELVLPADDLSSLVDRITAVDGGNAAGADGLRSLTPREREILQTLAGGASTAEVAEAFGISPLTVQSHVKNILAKLGVHSKVDAVRIAWRHGVATASRPPARAG